MTTDKRYKVYLTDDNSYHYTDYFSGEELAEYVSNHNWAIFPRSWYNVGSGKRLPNPKNLVKSYRDKGFNVVFMDVKQFHYFKREYYEGM